MFRIIDCITVEHDMPLLLLAVAICLSGSVASVIVAGRARVAQNPVRWTVLLGLCSGATAWSTHFVSMLAYQSGLPITYDPTLTIASLIAGILLMGVGCHLACKRRSRFTYRLLGGGIVGGGVVALHYVGMAGIRLQGALLFDPGYVVASVVLSTVIGAIALNTIFGRIHAYTALLSAALLVAMILSLHFTGMAAIELQLHSIETSDEQGISRFVIALAVTIASFATLAVGTVAAVADRHLTNRLAGEAERFKTLSNGAFEGLIVHRDGVIIDANTAARKLLGLGESIRKRSLKEWIDELDVPLGVNDELVSEVNVRGANGETFPAEICRRRINLVDQRIGELVAIRDLTSRKKSEAIISHLARHDPLTDLPNRRWFGELSENALSHATLTGRPFAMMALDLDNFKTVNDVYGHAAGDQLIQTVAARLNEVISEQGVVARLGGDEFAILETSDQQPERAAELAKKILAVLNGPIALENGGQSSSFSINASIGVAVYPFDGTTIAVLLRNSDTAMYRAKTSGKATFRFFEENMNEASEFRHKIETGLRRALAQESFKVVYQPIVNSDDREPNCMEALLRWTDDELGSIPPDQFIPVAEASGLIVPIGEFVLRQACNDAVGWPAPIRVAVNLSAVQFKDEALVSSVHQALERSGLPGDRLELEITESLLIDNRDDALRQLNVLKALGINIAMDDFGTGYSSLSYLQSFGFDKLKIDRIFVSNLETNQQNASIVRAVISMAQSLSMKVVAEGVETDEQAAILSEMSCDQLQGYLISKPMPADEITLFLESKNGISSAR